MGIYYVCYLCQLTPQLQNYSIPWTITYQADLIGRFVWVYAQMKRLWWLGSFQVWQHGSRRLLSNVNLHTVSSIRKYWWFENYHLSLTVFCNMRLKLSTTSKYMPIICICSISFVKRWMQNINAYSCTQKLDGFLEANRWLEILSYKSPCRFLLENESPLAEYFSNTDWVLKLCDIFNLLNKLNLSLQGKISFPIGK